MQKSMMKYGGALFFAGVLALAGCSGEQGDPGEPGEQGDPGEQGNPGNDGMNGVAGELKLVIDGVATATANAVTTSTVTFTIYPAVAACPGGTCNDTLSNLSQKTFYATQYDAATGTFPTGTTASPKSFNFTGFKFKALVDGGKGAQYTATKANAPYAPETSQDVMIYGYIGDQPVLPNKGSYRLLDNVASASKVYGAIAYTSAANVSGCEKCHGAPYSKHGYRQASVAGLPDMASCKACHTDQRNGGHQDWQALVDMPREYAEAGGVLTADQKTKYAYVASVMNDTHMSHAMEFAYPQSMANCVTCHEGKLDVILADKFFTLKTCKSCHPVTGPLAADADGKRAPPLRSVLPTGTIHAGDLYAWTGSDCNSCHKAGAGFPTFAQIHSGRTASIYAADGARRAATITTAVDSATFDATTNVLTVAFSMSGLPANAMVKPTVVVSLYGYDTKDFLVSGHGSAADGTYLLEYTEGAMQRSDPTKSALSDRLQVAPLMTAGNSTWTATANLSTWAAQIADKRVNRVEIAILPSLGLDPTLAPQSSATKPAYNPYVAVKGISKTFNLVAKALVADNAAYGRAIVDTAKCNACHDALATTFHNANYGSAGVVGCRVCHVAGTAGGHLEMQSRSIDSYVHAIHAMQPFDIADVDFADKLAALRYGHHTESTYPNFSILNCESCHNPGTYEVPDQSLSLPGVLSAAATVTGTDRAIGTVASVVVGPASRACGSCHRAELINEDAFGELVSFNQHTAMFGTQVTSGTGVFDGVTADLMGRIGYTPAAVTGAQVESCSVCHPNAGADHQAAFNRYADGL